MEAKVSYPKKNPIMWILNIEMLAVSLLQIIARGQRHMMLLPSVLQMDIQDSEISSYLHGLINGYK